MQIVSKSVFLRLQLTGVIVSLLLILTGSLSYWHRATYRPLFSLVEEQQSFWQILPYQGFTHKIEESELVVKVPLKEITGTIDLIVKVDDCLLGLTVNDFPVEVPRPIYCNWRTPLPLTNVSNLRIGQNIIKAHIRNTGGPGYFDLSIVQSENSESISQRLQPLQIISFLIAAFILSFLFARQFFGSAIKIYFSVLFGLGVVLRIFYFFATPYNQRSHDVEGHVQYIRYVMSTMGIPDAVSGWQFYQPPLYYWLVAMSIRIGNSIGFVFEPTGEVALLISLILSVLTLLAVFIVLFRVLAKCARSAPLIIGAAFTASFPGLITTTVRVNNDSMAIALSFLAIMFYFDWWRNPGKLNWYASMLLAALGAWSKLTFLPVSLSFIILPLLRNNYAVNTRMRQSLKAAFFIIIPIVVYSLVRFINSPDSSLFFNGKSINATSRFDRNARVANSVANFTTFSPAGLLEWPEAIGNNREARNWAFWEYFFKSAFFSTTSIPEVLLPLAKLITLFALMALLILVFQSGASKGLLPLKFTIIAGLIAIILYRINAPIASAQNFRYFAPSSLGLFVMLPAGLSSISTGILRGVCYLILITLSFMQGIYLVSIGLLTMGTTP